MLSSSPIFCRVGWIFPSSPHDNNRSRAQRSPNGDRNRGISERGTEAGWCWELKLWTLRDHPVATIILKNDSLIWLAVWTVHENSKYVICSFGSVSSFFMQLIFDQMLHKIASFSLIQLYYFRQQQFAYGVLWDLIKVFQYNCVCLRFSCRLYLLSCLNEGLYCLFTLTKHFLMKISLFCLLWNGFINIEIIPSFFGQCSFFFSHPLCIWICTQSVVSNRK